MLPTFLTYRSCSEMSLAGRQVCSERKAGATARCEPWPGPARHAGVTPPSLPPASFSTAAATGMFFLEEVAAAVVWEQAVGGRRAMESERFSVVACTPLCHLSMSQ